MRNLYDALIRAKNTLFASKKLTFSFLTSLLVVGILGFTGYRTSDLPKSDPDNGGLFLPDGFEAVVVVDSLKGRARHMAVNANGDI